MGKGKDPEPDLSLRLMDPGGPKNADPADLVSDPQHCRRQSESRNKLPEEGSRRILRKLISTKRQPQNAKKLE
jgi:hypothetical protein